jgi:hypothetical protein
MIKVWYNEIQRDYLSSVYLVHVDNVSCLRHELDLSTTIIYLNIVPNGTKNAKCERSFEYRLCNTDYRSPITDYQT